MRILRLLPFLAGLSLVALLLPGCGSDPLGTLYPVTGKVTLDDEPLKDAQISFVADKDKGNNAPVSPFGKCKDGSYTLTSQDKPGAPAGTYKVVVMTQYPGGPDNPTAIPQKYTDAGKTDLRVEVKPSGGDYNLKLTSK